MYRLHRAIHGVASSYILLAATALYSLGSIPVALHYLDKSQFGLWVVMGTVAGYLNLMDMGITGAASRMLIDHKDDRDGGEYGSLLKTGLLVCSIQGGIIFLTGLVLSRWLSQLLAIPDSLQLSFIQLMQWQCGAMGLSFSMRILGMMLGAHQRMDISNYTGAFGLIVNLGIQWIFFHLGQGVMSLAFGALGATLFAGVSQFAACFKQGFFPARGSWGRMSWIHFKELFLFGKDLLIVSAGAQMIMASQSIVITRMLGLEAAAAWGVGTRVYHLLNQLIWRISDMSGAAFAEMMIRGEYERIKDRYKTIAMLSFSVAGWVAVSFVSCNSLFIKIWTHGKINWPVENDILLGILMIIGAIVHCHGTFILVTKKIGFMRYIYFLEGSVFVILSFLVARQGGVSAIIFSSIICSLLFSGSYLVWRICDYFGLKVQVVAFGWILPASKMLGILLPVFLVAIYLTKNINNLEELGINIMLTITMGLYLLYRFGVDQTLKQEIKNRAPSWLSRYLNYL
jgi:O-antigen/teichoic acid export membrane protein